ncbi:MAG: HD domain-containing protein [Nitrospinae bacterium]|nr:HD domain-containing protein [Nitrospinota bacterium]
MMGVFFKKYPGKIIISAVAYFLAGETVFSLPIGAESASAFFVPSGVALAAIAFWGSRVWPGVFLGSFALNLIGFFDKKGFYYWESESSLFTVIFFTLLIGMAASVQALLGGFFLRPNISPDTIFDHPKHVLTLFIFSGFLSCLIGPTLGTLGLSIIRPENLENLKFFWLTWWLGDSTGVIIITPAILLLKRIKTFTWDWARIGEFTGLIVFIVLLAHFTFNPGLLKVHEHLHLQFVILPVLLWITLRFGETGAAYGILCVSFIAASGSFEIEQTSESLLVLQSYIGVNGMTFLILSAINNQRNLLEQKVLKRTQQLNESRMEVVLRLGKAAEYKDNETGMHVLRMSHMSALIGRAHGLNDKECELLLLASPMHDIGKIGIPDNILLKPENLDREEWKIMKTHTTIGGKILSGVTSELVKLSELIALMHQEKWDGSGYPNGLKGAEIPLVGRIVALADVFDALTSRRPYKEPWSVEEAVTFIESQSGKHFDPQLVPLMRKVLPEMVDIKERYSETLEEVSHL